MAQTIKLKRSATENAVPTTSQLELGEVAINTYDGKLYIKKDVAGSESIVEVGGLSSVTLGGLSDVTVSSVAADQLLQYNGSAWVNVSLAEASAIMKEYQFTATAGQSTFTGADDNSETLSYTAGAIQVFLNGIFLDSAVDYTATSGTSIVLTETVDANDYLQIVAFKKKIGDGNVSVDTFTGDDSTVAFTLSVDPGDENNTRVFIDGVYQSKSNYSVSGTTLTFSTAPPTGTAVEVEIGNRVVTLDTLSDLDLPDDVKLRLGTDQDLEIFHNGTNSVINQTGTGDLLVQKDETTVAEFTVDGIVVTGDVEADEFIGDLRGAILFKAQAGEALAKGDVVYISGISGNTTIVSKADADDASKMPAFGLAAAASTSGTTVEILTSGILSEVDTSAYSEGDELFVSTTAGALTATAPTGEASALQKIGKVTRSNNLSGSIFITGAGRSNAVPNLDDGDIFLGNSSNQAVSASLNTKIEEYLDSGVSTPTFAGLATTANMTFGDNDKAIFGAGSDLQIFSEGSSGNSFISEEGSGTLFIQGTDLRLRSGQTPKENFITAIADGAVTLYHNNAEKLATTSTGIDVTGTVTADGLTVDGNGEFNGNAISLDFMEADQTDKNLRLRANGGVFSVQTLSDNKSTQTNRFQVSHTTGDVSFYEDTGTTAKMVWKSADERLGVGTSSPDELLHLSNTGGNAVLKFTRDDTATTSGSSVGTIQFAHTDADNPGVAAAIVGKATNAFGKVALLFSTGNPTTKTERMRLDAEGNLGIGTDSPAEPLHVQAGSSGITSRAGTIALIEGSGNTKLTVASGTTSTGELLFGSSADNDAGRIIYDHSDDGLQVWTNGSRAVDVDSSGNVGIGTSSPSQPLHVNSGNNNDVALFESTDLNARMTIKDNTTTNTINANAGRMVFSADSTNAVADSYMGFEVDNSEAMRIDASGNLLVGTTRFLGTSDLTGGETGFVARSDGFTIASRDSNTVLIVNRNTSDGSIAIFRKDGTTVGSIGTESSGLVVGSGNVGVRFIDSGQDRIIPRTTALGNTDNAIDLGDSGSRFKDLYLSGGVYLGGTGSANKLDDYEEGTFTFSLHDAASGGNQSATSKIAYYTKIGNQVTVHVWGVNNIDTTGMTAGNSLYFALPFTSSSIGRSVGSVIHHGFTYAGNSANGDMKPFVSTSDSRGFFATVGYGRADNSVKVSDVSSVVDDIHTLTLTYFV